MIFYRIELCTEGDGSLGYSWHTSRRAAEARLREFRRDHEDATPEAIEPIEIEPTRDGILAALNAYAAHPNNG